VLGNLVKPCHPRSVGLSKFMKQVRKIAVGERYRFMKKGEGESPVEFRMFSRFVVVDMKIMAELGPCIRTVNLFEDVHISWKSGIRNSRES
jgi:hypothetical protein